MIKLKIDEIKQNDVQYGKKITIVSNNDKYSFFSTKRDGNPTKAYSQYKPVEEEPATLSIGDTVIAQVKEEPDSFVNEKGKTINYTKRTILYFSDTNTVENLKKSNPTVSREEFENLEARVKNLEGEDLSKDLNNLPV